jgi:hypothetical protein
MRRGLNLLRRKKVGVPGTKPNRALTQCVFFEERGEGEFMHYNAITTRYKQEGRRWGIERRRREREHRGETGERSREIKTQEKACGGRKKLT